MLWASVCSGGGRWIIDGKVRARSYGLAGPAGSRTPGRPSLLYLVLSHTFLLAYHSYHCNNSFSDCPNSCSTFLPSAFSFFFLFPTLSPVSPRPPPLRGLPLPLCPAHAHALRQVAVARSPCTTSPPPPKTHPLTHSCSQHKSSLAEWRVSDVTSKAPACRSRLAISITNTNTVRYPPWPAASAISATLSSPSSYDPPLSPHSRPHSH